MKTAADILRENGLPLPPNGEDRYYSTCPECSAQRSMAHQKTKCLGINITAEGVNWGCNHCGWTGGGFFNGKDNERDPIVATFVYTDEAGAVLSRKQKTAAKNYWQERPAGNGGWINETKGVRRVLYRLPELIEDIANDHLILIVEGEKDVDNLRKIGVPATCNIEGAAKPGQKQKWKAEYSEALRGADIIVIPDHDDPGYAHADATAELSNGITKSVRVLKLADHWPDCPEHGDISDWIAAGHTREQLDDLIAQAKPWTPTANKSKQTDRGWRDHVYTAAELQHKTFPPISYCVPDLIPEGLTIIAGKPKIGKSWMALDICIASATGRFCLGERKPIQGDVLYAAMEDNPRRMQRRIDRLLSPVSAQWPERLTLTNSWRRLDQGGVDDVRDWIDQANIPRLVILDTLAGVKPIRTREGYTEDYESLAALHRLANEKGVSIIVLHHTRKMEADDPVDTVSGTLGLAGCADSVLILNRTAQGTTLYVRGRDIEEAEHAVVFDKAGCRWTILGNATDVHRSQERGKILEVLLNATELLGPQQIADDARMKADNVRYLLGQMVIAGEVMKAARGRYYHPNRSDLCDPSSHVPNPHKGKEDTNLTTELL